MTNPTTPFSWQMPTASDLVTDLPADFETFGQAVATSMADLLGGTTGQILSKASNTDMDFTWVTNDIGDITAVNAGTGISGGGTSGAVTITNTMATEITASGDIIVGTGSGTFDNLPIGTTGQVLTADTTVSPYKVKWATPAGSAFAGARANRSGDQSISNTTATAVSFNAEVFDTDNFHSTSTNPSRMTIPTGKGGYYQVNAMIKWSSINAPATVRQLRLYVNGSNLITYSLQWNSNDDGYQTYGDILSLSAGDYVEFYVWQNSGSSTNVQDLSTFSLAKLG